MLSKASMCVQRITYMHGRIGGSGAFFVNRANNIFQNFLFTNLQSEHAQARADQPYIHQINRAPR